MKLIPLFGAGLTTLLLGCSTPVAVAPVGPNPDGSAGASRNGQLEVFSVLVGHTEGNNPAWYQHANYRIYDPLGRRVKYVGNADGHYAQAPRLVTLPPGHYVVQAEAADYLSVKVPVVIKPGRITRVHLDDAWHPAPPSKLELVSLPTGNAVGWVP